ncbi:hypothetical protein CO613_11690 [Lysobacteraceae bacterium NML07-0707]|nr:hypothetical protein CO613_11690 [Xanthomonadaceae bacterium NML07-0707]
MDANKAFLAVAALLTATGVRAQEQLEPALAVHVPSGWEVTREAVYGDLNRDGRADVVLVLQALGKTTKSADEEGEEKPRWLRVLVNNGGGYRLLAESTDLIPSNDADVDPCWSDPLDEISISNGKLEVNFNYWSSCGSYGVSNSKYLFREEGGRMRLIGYDRQEFSRSTGEEDRVSYNYLTGRKKTVEGGNVFDEKARSRERWERFPRQPYYLDGPMPSSY